MAGKFTNNASSTLAGSISAAATAISVPSGEGALFPVLTAGDWCRLTLTKLVGGLPVYEIVKATARAGDIFTIVRAQESTAATTFTAGDKVELRITAGVLGDLAPLSSPAFTDSPTTPTQVEADDSTKVSSTAFANRAAQTALNKVAGGTAVLASAATVNIGAANVGNIAISGVATITAFDTIAEGTLRWLVFSAALTLTHHVTALQLPSAANIVTAAGDTALFKSLGGGNWKCLCYERASGVGLVASSSTKNGYLSSADWTTFNAKQAALGFTPYNSTNPAGYTSAAAVAATYLAKTGSDRLVVNAGASPPTDSTAAITTSGAFGGGFKMIDGANQFLTWSNTGVWHWGFGSGAAFTSRMNLTSAGTLSAVVITQTSDERKKRDWKPLTDAQLDALAGMKLSGTFEWIEDGARSVGGSAQEIMAIVPEAVPVGEDGSLTVNYGGLNFAILQAMLRRQRELA